MISAVRRRLQRGHAEGDAGLTLVELMVSLIVFSLFLTILLSAVIGITRASSRAQLLSRSSSNVLIVFQNLDRQIRYANAINFPGAGPSGSRYIEFRTGAESAPTGVVTCTQWRYNPAAAAIQTRTWPDVVGASPTPWVTKISDVTDLGTPDYPFKMIPAAIGASSMQQMAISVSSGTPLVTPGAAISTNLVARNSSIQSPSNSNVIVAGVSDTPVCLSSGSRP